MRAKKILSILLVLVFLSFTTGCLGGLFNNKPIIESAPEDTAKVGIEYTYEIVATDPDEDDILTYSLSEKPDDMTINETTGAISWTPTGDQVGDHQVTIEVSDGEVSVSQSFTITVAEVLLSSIEVVPSEMNILKGSSETIISITAHYDNGTTAVIELDSADVISYSSDTEEIAAVSELGVVIGVDRGTAIITVTYTEEEITVTDTIDVTVLLNLNYIKVLPEFMIIYKGNSQSITSIKAYYEGSTTPVDIALNEVTYDIDSSGTPGIITVNDSGVVTGVSASSDWQTITVSYTEGSITKTDIIYVIVEELPAILDSISAFPEIMTLVEGESKNIDIIRAYYSNGSYENLELDAAGLVYGSNNVAVATVDNSGVITGISTGTATIAVSYTEAGITKIDMIAVTVI
jgi:hypothetical protein